MSWNSKWWAIRRVNCIANPGKGRGEKAIPETQLSLPRKCKFPQHSQERVKQITEMLSSYPPTLPRRTPLPVFNIWQPSSQSRNAVALHISRIQTEKGYIKRGTEESTLCAHISVTVRCQPRGSRSHTFLRLCLVPSGPTFIHAAEADVRLQSGTVFF